VVRPPAPATLVAVALIGALGTLAAGCRRGEPPAAATSASSPASQTDAAAGFSASPPEPSASGGGRTLRYGIREPEAIVPFAATGRNSLTVVDALFDSLTAIDGTGRVTPAAATQWTTEGRGRIWSFRLRQGATFHDGRTPVTAADVKFAWEQAVRLGKVGYHLALVEGYRALRSGSADELAGVTAVDDHTLRVRLTTPMADFPAVVAHPTLAPVPQAAYQADPEAFAERPIGNGPFEAAEAWSHNAFIRLRGFDQWRDGPRPRIDEIVFRISSSETAYLSFQQGRLDFTRLPAGALRSARQDYASTPSDSGGPRVLRGHRPALYYIGFDTTRPPFDEPAVRKAFSAAVDRRELADTYLEGNLTAARSALLPAIVGSVRSTCPRCRRDTSFARRVFAERGIDELTLWVNENGGHEAVARQLADHLDAAGVVLRVRSEPFDVYRERLAAGGARLFRFGWSADYPILDDVLYPLLHSRPRSGSRQTAPRRANHGRYANARVDVLLETARATRDPQTRRRRYRTAERIAVGRDQAIAPLFTYHHAAVVSGRVRGLSRTPNGLANLAELSLTPAPDG
jgi:peptide/nickel transport system substrate-binding protein/oligopeptide transport system substrate-binding protein